MKPTRGWGSVGNAGGWGRLQSSAGQRPVLKSEGQQRPWGVQDVTPSPRGAPEEQGAPSGAGRGVWYRNRKGGSSWAKGEAHVADSSSPTRCLTHIQCILHFALTAPILTVSLGDCASPVPTMSAHSTGAAREQEPQAGVKAKGPRACQTPSGIVPRFGTALPHWALRRRATPQKGRKWEIWVLFLR